MSHMCGGESCHRIATGPHTPWPQRTHAMPQRAQAAYGVAARRASHGPAARTPARARAGGPRRRAHRSGENGWARSTVHRILILMTVSVR
jgi:hypothetical protein